MQFVPLVQKVPAVQLLPSVQSYSVHLVVLEQLLPPVQPFPFVQEVLVVQFPFNPLSAVQPVPEVQRGPLVHTWEAVQPVPRVQSSKPELLVQTLPPVQLIPYVHL